MRMSETGETAGIVEWADLLRICGFAACHCLPRVAEGCRGAIWFGEAIDCPHEFASLVMRCP